MITPNDDQQAALDKIQDFIADPSRVTFSLGGLAGTGKSTIIPLVNDLVDLPIAIATPTGKAAAVVNAKFGRKIATTIHQLAYAPLGNRRSGRKDFLGRDEYEPLFEESYFASPLTIIDEASMVDDIVYDRLLAIPDNRYLFVGDHGQLPPVKSDSISKTLAQRDHTLTEIVRQAEDSPIRSLAYEVRQGAALTQPTQGIEVVPYQGLMAVADRCHNDGIEMLIAATNKIRNILNQHLRALQGLGDAPAVVAGEKIILTSNNHGMQVFNGEIYHVKEVHSRQKHNEGDVVIATITDGERVIPRIKLGFQWRTHLCYDQGLVGCDLGYCLTCHKAQGSQADNVAVLAENVSWMKDLAPAWRYTAVTRAAKNLLIFEA